MTALETTRLSILRAIADEPGVTTPQLAARAGDRGYLVGDVTRRLHRKGLIRRDPIVDGSPPQRTHALRLTPAGRDVIANPEKLNSHVGRRAGGMKTQRGVIAELIRLVDESGYTASEVSGRAGYGRDHVSRWRAGSGGARLQTVVDMGQFLGYELKWVPIKKEDHK